MAKPPGTAHAAGAHAMPSSSTGPHGGYTMMMSEEDFHSTQSMEMTRFIREHFKTPKTPPYKLENIRCRNSTTRIRERDAALWRDHYGRRHGNMGRGFYTPNHKPYHSVGEVQLNMQRLLLDTLEQYLPKELPIQSLTSRFGRRDLKASPAKVDQVKTPVKEPPLKERLDPDVDEKLRERALETAGYAYIKQRLEESEAVLKAERGGQSFEKCTKKIKEMKKHANQLGRKPSSLTFNPPDLRAWSPMSSSSSTPGTRGKPTLADIVDMERRVRARRKRLLIGKLQCIMKVMNALHNIKTRDIKSRVPMSHDQVKHLYRDVTWERPALSHNKPLGTTSMRSPQQQAALEAGTRIHSSADTVSSGEHQMAGGVRSSKPALPGHSSMSMHGKGGASDAHSPSSAQPWKRFGYHANIRKGFRLERENKIDTWEDLLTSSSPGPNKRNSVQPTLISLSQPVNAVLRWTQHHMDHKQKQPYWMMQGVASDEKVKRATQPVVNAKGSKLDIANEPDAAATLESIQQNFKKTQKKLAREALQDLERLDRDRQRVIKQKFQVITESPLFERTVQLLKEARAHHGAPVISIDEDSEIKLSPWYMELKASTEVVLGKTDPDVASIFNTLSQFSLEDGKSIPNAKEKLCLLVMSMPASELLTIEMQLAIAFVLEEILWAPPKALAQWLHHRKVPLIIEINVEKAD